MSLANYLHTAPWFLLVRVALSFIYGSLISLRNQAYDLGLLKTYPIKTPVISVGNISTGGSGKTILVQALVEHFLSIKKTPAVLSRGYGRSSKGLVVVADNSGVKTTVKDSGDEPFLIAQNFSGVPVVVSENRVIGAQYLEDNFSPDVVILDDGFQHRRLHRDLDIVIIDFLISQKQRLLPWGLLRETAGNISRADVVVFSKISTQEDVETNLVFELDSDVNDHLGNRLPLTSLGGDYGLFAGLGKPDHFFNQLEDIHHPASIKISFPDHAQYTELHRSEIESNTCAYWITTQKDFIKLDPAFCEEHRIYSVGVKTIIPARLLAHLKQHFN
ncbi:MAG: tetraacyldisaccharide 4'-kinase [Candidatus Marinimicrobia bacterium]|jgi:tetraacyldisaccharide 4'-kinase|nr:tetraacyldisaccharide 4'-kinase [Candidatus Neomarinimicrobiota bacterium]MBT4359355.1 tetraacyldisaccharide 4'-kinase [Candidatus Neomarinimicrobiota bacterium]MBT4714272.1 tetraacyldisaccharide 4'-kinase [Candidatus Neomarinimicrobiota bacterium]MBT4946738.1 tetraacyldisaccharide 4'-kinase [Candidatus Neomarinimicrobiota bacterium]MBT5269229.1 tetraacyldisaccharide 4'-kinase [Candidatus Neomarinimicrobiota bacterium]